MPKADARSGKFNQPFDTQLSRQFINTGIQEKLMQIRKTIMAFQ